MRLVIDSNRLQTEQLRVFLARSKRNVAVLTDFAAMEAYKGDTLASIYKSMNVVSAFPQQVLVLKRSRQVCGLSGRRKGLQRRLIDEKQTSEFATYVKALARANSGNQYIQQQLLRHGTESQKHLDEMLRDAADMRRVFDELAKAYTKEERAIIRTGKIYTATMVDKLTRTLLDISDMVFTDSPLVRQAPSSAELPNTFLFRVSLCCYLMAVRWGVLGGASNASPSRIRNDMVDMTFAAYGTYFDGLLSDDVNVNRIYVEACLMLDGLFDAEVPRLDHLRKQ